MPRPNFNPQLIDIVYLEKDYLSNILRCLSNSIFFTQTKFLSQTHSLSNTLLRFSRSLFLSLWHCPQSMFTSHSYISIYKGNNCNDTLSLNKLISANQCFLHFGCPHNTALSLIQHDGERLVLKDNFTREFLMKGISTMISSIR